MKKELYTIGETARLFGISAQTLRFYDREGILSPIYINPDTGYRYYSYEQFHIIDRIKYLQGFGLSLEDISAIIRGGTVEGLMPFLHRQKENLREEIRRAEEQIRDIEWYVNYFTYMDGSEDEAKPYLLSLERRYVLSVPCLEGDALSDMEIRLAEVEGRPQYKKLPFRRQYGYTLDFEGLLQQQFHPYTYFTYLRREPEFPSEYFDVLPEGEYICFRTKLLKENWRTEVLQKYFQETAPPKLIVALEFEDNLVDWSDAQYEVQILI